MAEEKDPREKIKEPGGVSEWASEMPEGSFIRISSKKKQTNWEEKRLELVDRNKKKKKIKKKKKLERSHLWQIQEWKQMGKKRRKRKRMKKHPCACEEYN